MSNPMTFDDLGSGHSALADEMTGLVRDLGNALTAARDIRDRAASAANLGLRDGDAEYFAAKDKALRAALAALPQAEPRKTVPRRWWDAIRSHLESAVDAADRADSLSFSMGAAAVRRAKSRREPALYALARMDEMEGSSTLEAALDARLPLTAGNETPEEAGQ